MVIIKPNQRHSDLWGSTETPVEFHGPSVVQLRILPWTDILGAENPTGETFLGKIRNASAYSYILGAIDIKRREAPKSVNL